MIKNLFSFLTVSLLVTVSAWGAWTAQNDDFTPTSDAHTSGIYNDAYTDQDTGFQ